ncbi:unnamed protein product [Enterobius vermicularis]|uniref:DUF5658 domain-containing protein n=1 Tax=Enterobius vermicularis TaxID=51028 RepID=A0A0N4VPL8_ENTVE|nr:unnamed protein product [Enterobius vermicularis]
MPNGKRILPFWVEAWLTTSAILCTLDVVYTMLRPATLRNGRLGGVYVLWNIYSDIDLRYANEKDLVTMATGRIMIVEIVMDVIALLLAVRGSRHTLLVAFTTSAFAFWKTLLYMTLYIMPPEG